jgi:hypothetical protein
MKTFAKYWPSPEYISLLVYLLLFFLSASNLTSGYLTLLRHELLVPNQIILSHLTLIKYH